MLIKKLSMLIKKLSMFIKKYCVGNITSLLIKKCYAKGTISILIKKRCVGNTTSFLIKNVVPETQQAFFLKTVMR